MKLKYDRGSVVCTAPSNIALVKYWGKKDIQIPLNPSISFTLDTCYTKTKADFELGDTQTQIEFYFHGESKPSFIPKLEVFIERVKDLYPWLGSLAKLTLHSENSFPHSSGIASSASGFGAMAMCFEKFNSEVLGEEIDLDRASNAARLGSGSACRSVFGGFNLWGELTEDLGDQSLSSQLTDIHPNFDDIKDAICIASSGEKSVGSSAGHSLMNNHVFGEQRINQAKDNCRELLSCLRSGDVWKAGELIEEEAMTLHALMMTSRPSYMLIRPNTVAMIEVIRQFREDEKTPVFFTLDAGPNPHVIYFNESRTLVEQKLLPKLKGLCENERIIMDQIGKGPKILESSFE
ncbi:MAG: diphosphomevalonate decarboxylase [Bacteriovoracaceae bacterium]|nr:diphosphomevalonate decarboxylase [Bacteriovoracaceae bacterium]